MSAFFKMARHLLLLSLLIIIKTAHCDDLRVFTVATEPTDGFLRFNRSLSVYNLKSEILGLGSQWQGGNVADSVGGGYKVNLLKEALKRYKDDSKLIILFTDSYDVVVTSDQQAIIDDFKSFDANILFSAEKYCWPDSTLESLYPLLPSAGKRYLNSGAFIGYAPVIYEIISSAQIGNTDDDQLFYTKIYLNESLREKYQIKLDHRSKLFQNLNGAFGEVQLKFTRNDAYIENTHYNSRPKIVHGNGGSKIHLNALANYLAKSWTLEEGCTICTEKEQSKNEEKRDENGEDASTLLQEREENVLMCLFVEHATPFLEEFFEDIERLNLSKARMSVRIHNSEKHHRKHVQDFVDRTVGLYRSIKIVDLTIPEWQARNLCLEECLMDECSFYLSVDSDARLTNANTVSKLIAAKKDVIAPLLVRPGKLWSNFWGSLSPEGYYARSFDYVSIVKNERRGIWNVPHISGVYLISGSLIKKGFNVQEGNEVRRDSSSQASLYPNYMVQESALDADMAFSYSLRRRGIFMYISNLETYGHLVDSESYSLQYKQPDLHEIFNNQLDWQRRYIHPNYSSVLAKDHVIEQPCPDVYWFPLVTPTFCKHLIDEMENFGKWSSGTNQDERLAGGYENVPTRDIHMNQVALEKQWLYFLREYVRPVQEKVFTGYFHDPPKAIMNFVVRYRPDEQPFLRPHHDASTYTINIALNRPHIDYQGGGCRFIRYNCSVTHLRQGWSLIHPGRLTHYHEGLYVTGGTRYIMVSFVDP